VVCDPNGDPIYDRPIYREAPNVNIVAWGRDREGVPHVAVIQQPRPHADDPENSAIDGHAPITFGQLPMGFMNSLLGEDGVAAARRETSEETGASTVLNVSRPSYPWHNPNPAFVGTWSDLYFVQVDLERIQELRATRSEPIYAAEYIPVPELIHRVAAGKDTQGAVYRMCTANSLWFIFLCTYPELWRP